MLIFIFIQVIQWLNLVGIRILTKFHDKCAEKSSILRFFRHLHEKSSYFGDLETAYKAHEPNVQMSSKFDIIPTILQKMYVNNHR